jgi:hypothetical protein
MTAVKAYYDGKSFVPLSPVRVTKNQRAIVTVLDDDAGAEEARDCLQFAGYLSDEDYQEITTALQATERVDKSEW